MPFPSAGAPNNHAVCAFARQTSLNCSLLPRAGYTRPYSISVASGKYTLFMSQKPPTRLLIADDHQLVREMLRMLLNEGEFAIDTAESLPDALAHIESAGGYDIVLLDVLMPGMGGLIGVKKAIAANTAGAVVILSGDLRQSFVKDAMAHGARGYIPKSMPALSFIEALRQIAAGKTYLPIKHVDAPQVAPPELANLSTQERRVLTFLCEGMSNKAIANAMDLTEITIKTHMRGLCAKIGARNRTEAALIARNFPKP